MFGGGNKNIGVNIHSNQCNASMMEGLPLQIIVERFIN
jgi:hypothetical protein